MNDQMEKRGLYLDWDKSVHDAITCLVLIANGGLWRRWEQHETDTRGIVTERAANAIIKQLNSLQRSVNDATETEARP